MGRQMPDDNDQGALRARGKSAAQARAGADQRVPDGPLGWEGAPLCVLMVEDSEEDVLLLARALRGAGYEPAVERVDTGTALRAALDRGAWDAVLIDYVMPQFSPLSALEIVREKGLDLPCILVSGKAADETAIAAMKAGAHDFVTKDALARLPQVIERERRAAAARRAARENEARLRAVFETAVDGIITIGERGVVESLNPAAARMLGYAPEEVIGQNVNLLMPEPFHSEHQGYLERYLRTGEARIIGIGRDVEARRRDGTTFPIHLSVSEARLGGRRIFTGILHDITERKRGEAAARRLAAIVEASEEAILAMDPGGTVTDWNTGAERLYGYTAAEVVDRPVAVLMPPDAVGELQGILARACRGESIPLHDAVRVRKDGSQVDVAVSTAPIFDEAGKVVGISWVARDVTERKRAEDALRDANARLEEQAADLRAANEDLQVASTVVRSSVVTAEAARAEAEEASQAKDQFVAMVSHELRNPLNAITAGLHLLRQSIAMEGRAGRVLEIVERNANLQARLVNDLLDLSRLQRGKLQLQRAPVDLGKVVAAVCESTQSETREVGLSLTCAVDGELWVHGDQDRLQQVVTNLLSNAAKFTPAPGSIGVTAGRAALSGRVGEWESGRQGDGAVTQGDAGSPIPPFPHSPTLPEMALITVADTGIGISPELLPDLFEVFCQGEIASHRAAGLGLGLALVKGIVEGHGGRVWAESQGVGKGSRFLVELPLVPAPVRVHRPPVRDPARPVRVLVIEDLADTRLMLAEALALAGYEVHTAGSGEEALALLAQGMGEWENGRMGERENGGTGESVGSVSPTPPLSHSPTLPFPPSPDILLVDIGLPGMDGNEFLRQARQQPGMAEVLAFAVTGFGSEEDVRRGREAGFAAHLVKPVNVPALLERVREWMGCQE